MSRKERELMEVVIIAGSDSDSDHVRRIKQALAYYEIKVVHRICSAHKQLSKMQELIDHYNQISVPLVIVTVAGGTDALSGVMSFNSIHPVISCPPQFSESCLLNPPGSSNSFINLPANVAKHIAKIFVPYEPRLRKLLLTKNKVKVMKLEQCDERLNE